jgi:hypothetical protein
LEGLRRTDTLRSLSKNASTWRHHSRSQPPVSGSPQNPTRGTAGRPPRQWPYDLSAEAGVSRALDLDEGGEPSWSMNRWSRLSRLASPSLPGTPSSRRTGSQRRGMSRSIWLPASRSGCLTRSTCSRSSDSYGLLASPRARHRTSGRCCRWPMEPPVSQLHRAEKVTRVVFRSTLSTRRPASNQPIA